MGRRYDDQGIRYARHHVENIYGKPDDYDFRNIGYHPYRIHTSGAEYDFSRSADDRADALERIAQQFLARC